MASLSSLASQLHQLGGKPIKLTASGAPKSQPSILFNPYKARNLDRDAVFNIGVNGFLALSQIVPELGGWLMQFCCLWSYFFNLKMIQIE